MKIMISPSKQLVNFDTSLIINNRNIMMIIVVILFSGILQTIFNKLKNKEKIKEIYHRYFEVIVICLLMFVSIMMLASNTYNPFIYFRF